MKNVYLYLDAEQKAAIKKIQYKKRLSMSAVVETLFKYYATSTTENYYIHKGTKKTKIHLRQMDIWDKNKSLDLWVNNALQKWYANRTNNQEERNRKIQSELDKKEGTDPYWNYNETYRMLSRYKKEQKNK